MATATEYLGLTKPTEEEYVSVDVINENMEKIDLEARSARPVKKGGTGKTSWAVNRLIYASAAEVLAQMAFPTTAGSFLRQDKSGAPYWSTPEQVLAAIGAMLFYKYLSEIGLTAGSETIESIFNAMPTYSMLEINCTSGWTNNSIYPETEGTLTVYKQETHRATFRFVTASGSGVYEGAYAGIWSGWKQVFYADGSVPMTGALTFNNLSAYHVLTKGRTLGDGSTHFLTFGVSAGGTTTLEHYTCDSATFNGNKLDGRLELHSVTLDRERALRLRENASTTELLIFGEHNRPSGSYTGNGSATTRYIDVGVNFNVAIIRRSGATDKETFAIVTKSNGGACKSGTTTKTLTNQQISIGEKQFIITTNDDSLNANGIVYKYFILY